MISGECRICLKRVHNGACDTCLQRLLVYGGVLCIVTFGFGYWLGGK